MIIPENFAQATFIWGGAALPTGAVTTLGILNDGEESEESVSESVNFLWGEHVVPALSDDIIHLSTKVKWGPNLTGAEYEFASNVAGTVTGQCSPPNVTLLVKKVTGMGGRKGRGRMYLPGVSEASTDVAGVLDETYRGQVETDLADFKTDLAIINAFPVLLHTLEADSPNNITSFIVETSVATQRRRLRR